MRWKWSILGQAVKCIAWGLRWYTAAKRATRQRDLAEAKLSGMRMQLRLTEWALAEAVRPKPTGYDNDMAVTRDEQWIGMGE